MIYITCLTKNSNNVIIKYTGVEIRSDSPVELSKKILTEILSNTKIKVVNANIQNNVIEIKEWVNGLAVKRGKVRKPKYVLLTIDDNIYKVADYNGNVSNLEIEEIKNIIKLKDIANCWFDGHSIITEDIYSIQRDAEFEKTLATKYTNFVAKAALLGYNGITFEYEIENSEVRLTQYTGSSIDIILPSFITAIGKEAFKLKSIETVKLHEGVKVIGENAFSFNEIERIEIPSTIELIGNDAFSYNRKLFKDQYKLNKDRFKVRSNKTIILKQGF